MLKNCGKFCFAAILLSTDALTALAGVEAGWEEIEAQMAKSHWGAARQSLEAYVLRTPKPSNLTEAVVLLGRCREKTGDAAGAEKAYWSVVKDEKARRSSFKDYCVAYDRLHSILLAGNHAVQTRIRLVDNAARQIPGSFEFSTICEREGDAQLSRGDTRGAMGRYLAAHSLSEAGSKALGLLRKAHDATAPTLSDADVAALAVVAESKPQCLENICNCLSRCREGWRALDFLARSKFAGGDPAGAAMRWNAMLKRRRGPSDLVSLSYAEAIAEIDREKGLASIREWLVKYRESPLRMRAETVQGIILARMGKYGAATNVLERLAGTAAGNPYAARASEALAMAREAMDAIEKAERAAASKAMAQSGDPVAANIDAAEKLLASGRCREASSVLRKSIGARNHHLWGKVAYLLGKSLWGEDDSKGVLEVLGDAWRRECGTGNVANAAESRALMGDILLDEGLDFERAAKFYDEALDCKPALSSPEFDMNHAFALAAARRVDAASRIMEARIAGFEGAGDVAAAASWRRLAAQIAADGKSAAALLEVADRKAMLVLALADGLESGGQHGRAIKHYRKAMSGSAKFRDRAAFGAAGSLTQLGKPEEALRLYDKFASQFASSPLAPRALLRAGTLSASPLVKDFRKARGYFGLCAARHEGSESARAAEFYAANLAWRERKWEEAERLFSRYAEKYAGTELAEGVVADILPAVRARAASAAQSVDERIEVEVGPYESTRRAVPIFKNGAFNAELKVLPAYGYRIYSSGIKSPALADCLWTSSSPRTDECHTYRLANAFSSLEYVHIAGRLVPVKPSGRGPLPPFDITVPSVDIDWQGYRLKSAEQGEESRFVVGVLSTNETDWLCGAISRPRDNESISGVEPVLVLSWTPHDAATLISEDGVPFVNGGRIPTQQYEAAGGTWPLAFRVRPRGECQDLEITLEGQRDDGPYGQRKRAVDTIHATLTNAHIICHAAWRGENDDTVPDGEKFNPGFLVTQGAPGHLSAKLTFAGVPSGTFSRSYRISHGGLVKFDGVSTTTAEIPIQGNEDYTVVVEMDNVENWGNLTCVDVEYILRYVPGGEIAISDKCRLLRPYIVAVGDSLTYGVWLGLDAGCIQTNVPMWQCNSSGDNYPTTSDWANPAKVSPPQNDSTHQGLPEYQGFRGFLSQYLVGFTWLGINTKGHGPYHNGIPGAKISTIYNKLDKSHLSKNPSFTIIIYFAGMNNCNRGDQNEQFNEDAEADWRAKLESLINYRVGKGRTIILAMKIPHTKKNNYFSYYFDNLTHNIMSFNNAIDAYDLVNENFVNVVKVESGANIHPSPNGSSLSDDGMHFDSEGYRSLAQLIYAAILEAME